ncbi:hypothetical protein [Acinetobacter soli]|uniref:Uncharacterized protein n=2 Tax=Acinetobacter TaxID=469 RepID=A0A1P8EF31_9GAMM|nr:hypothetical protein [Acinetobacter soli]APV34814.1 hypothetical protein BEN76_01775 [Acinetobacter soli]
MEQNTINHNRPSMHLRLKHVALGSALLFGLSAAYAIVTEKEEPRATFPITQPSEYDIAAITLDSKHSGKAVIKLDGFFIYTGFDYATHNDDLGVPGSAREVVEITNLAIDRITSINGHEYHDFTVSEDHRNIITLIETYIEKKHLAGGV